MVRKVMRAKWLEDSPDAGDEKDPWLEKLAATIAMEKRKLVED
jgi:hypothetical protein